MELATSAPCYCGCRRAFDACHGLPRRERRRRAGQLQALAETHDVSALFPAVRPRDPVLLAYAEQMASTLDPADPRVPAQAVEDGVALLDETERRRIVADWVRDHADRWASVCAAAGDAALVERAFVASAVRGAISERRPFPRAPLAVLENRMLCQSPVAALGLVLPPPLVWDRDDAIIIGAAVGRIKSGDMAGFDAAFELARGRTLEVHVERVRTVAARLARALPVADLPVASATLGEGCAQVVEDDLLARELAALSSSRTPAPRIYV